MAQKTLGSLLEEVFALPEDQATALLASTELPHRIFRKYPLKMSFSDTEIFIYEDRSSTGQENFKIFSCPLEEKRIFEEVCGKLSDIKWMVFSEIRFGSASKDPREIFFKLWFPFVELAYKETKMILLCRSVAGIGVPTEGLDRTLDEINKLAEQVLEGASGFEEDSPGLFKRTINHVKQSRDRVEVLRKYAK